VLEHKGIESHVVDPASIATLRRRRRAKTDKIDGETLVRALLAHKFQGTVVISAGINIDETQLMSCQLIAAPGSTIGLIPPSEHRPTLEIRCAAFSEGSSRQACR